MQLRGGIPFLGRGLQFRVSSTQLKNCSLISKVKYLLPVFLSATFPPPPPPKRNSFHALAPLAMDHLNRYPLCFVHMYERIIGQFGPEGTSGSRPHALSSA